MPRSVLIFSVPESRCSSEDAIFSMSSWALIFGSSGSPESARAGTSPIVAAATPATATGTMYRAAFRRPTTVPVALPVVSALSFGAMCALPPWSAASVRWSRPLPAAILTRCGQEWLFSI
ncbi:hypothetical protein ACVWXU_005741 [Streptomyces sp. TE33382]